MISTARQTEQVDNALEQQIPVEEAEGAKVNPAELPIGSIPQTRWNSTLGGDDAEDYPPG
jgi:hypothetical protein